MFKSKIFSNITQWAKQLIEVDDLDNFIDIIDVRTTYKKDKGFFDTTLPTFIIIKVFHVNSGKISDIVKKENHYVNNEDFLLSQGFSIRYTQFDKRKPEIKVGWKRFPWEIENRVDIIDLYQQAHIGIATGHLVVKQVVEYAKVTSLYDIRKEEIFGMKWENKNVQDYLSEQKMFIRNYHPQNTEFLVTPFIKFDENTPKGRVIYDSRFPETSYKDLPDWIK